MMSWISTITMTLSLVKLWFNIKLLIKGARDRSIVIQNNKINHSDTHTHTHCITEHSHNRPNQSVTLWHTLKQVLIQTINLYISIVKRKSRHTNIVTLHHQYTSRYIVKLKTITFSVTQHIQWVIYLNCQTQLILIKVKHTQSHLHI